MVASMKDLYKKHSIIDENYQYLTKWLRQDEQKSMGIVIKIQDMVHILIYHMEHIILRIIRYVPRNFYDLISTFHISRLITKKSMS